MVNRFFIFQASRNMSSGQADVISVAVSRDDFPIMSSGIAYLALFFYEVRTTRQFHNESIQTF